MSNINYFFNRQSQHHFRTYIFVIMWFKSKPNEILAMTFYNGAQFIFHIRILFKKLTQKIKILN